MSNVYAAHVNEVLCPATPEWTAVDLFAGCGGLALGFESVGFQTTGFDVNADSVATYQQNLTGRSVEKLLTVDSELPHADVLIGGPPCQPFSAGGKQRGRADTRNGFPAFIAAVKKTSPRMFLFENVRGMLYKSRSYFDSVLTELTALGYRIDWRLLNAVNFGVPQNRQRLIVVGHQGTFTFPEQNLVTVTAGEAVGDLARTVPDSARWLTPAQDAYIARYEEKSKCRTPRDLHFDKPARTLTCRNLAGATSDMHRIRLPDGRRRRLTIAEAARLQSFPDWYTFAGSETSVFTQIGNAVSPLFARALAQSVADALAN
jgi:DNA (cytosine-5)-methyltransferase 1